MEDFDSDVFKQLLEYVHTGSVILRPRTLLGKPNAPWPLFSGLRASGRLLRPQGPGPVALGCPVVPLYGHPKNADTPLFSGLLNAADHFALEELRRACAEYSQKCINLDTVCSLLVTAERYIQYKSSKIFVQRVSRYP